MAESTYDGDATPDVPAITNFPVPDVEDLPEDLQERMVANWRAADISDAHLVMLDVAVKLTEEPVSVDEGDLTRLQEAGLSEAEIWDIGAVTAFFNLSNRIAIFTDNKPNAEFHTLGRPTPPDGD